MARSRTLLALVSLAVAVTTVIVGRPAEASTPPTPGTPSHDACVVHAAHEDFLDREATPDEVDHWLDQFTAGVHRSRLPSTLATSDEWLTVVVSGIYAHALDRDPEPDGLDYWIGELRRGAKVNRIASLVFGSAEFHQRVGGTAEGYVEGLYDLILERAPEPGGRAYWVGEVAHLGRSRVAARFYDSLESRTRRVGDLYDTLLGRSPDAGGLAYWATALLSVNDVRLAVELASSAEYRNRAQTSCSTRLRLAAPPRLALASVGRSYTAPLSLSGGRPPYAFTATGLPTGLAVGADGSISGTVAGTAAPGDRAVTVTVTDADGATATAATVLPVVVPVPGEVVDLDASLYAACAVMDTGAVWCWGNNSSRLMGDPPAGDALVPTQIPGLTTATRISMGGTFACVLQTAGTVSCWGNNAHGALGRGTVNGDFATPVEVVLPQPATQVVAGRYHACAVLVDATVRCWGYNTYGQLGTGSTSTTGLGTPQVVAGLDKIEEVAAGYDHTCARRQDGTVACWGRNDHGQLGRSGGNRLVPTTVPDLSGVTSVVAGPSATVCAVQAPGTLVCWGRNDEGQVGDAELPAAVTAPTPVLDGVSQVAVGQRAACAIDAEAATGWCWGRTEVLGIGLNSATPGPPSTVPDHKLRDLAVGEYFACGVGLEQGVSCWGRGGFLGDGTRLDRFSPVPVHGF